jgi:outer membrane protein assembly factor BamB
MKVNEVLISHWIGMTWFARRSKALITGYYNGVLFHRTPISCVGAVFFAALCFASASTAAITFPLEVKWSATLAAPPSQDESGRGFAPALDGDHVYVSLRTNQLVALRLQDGKEAWSVECPMTAPPAAGDSLVFAGSDGLVEARAGADGRAQWRRPVNGRVIALHWDTGWLLASTDTGPFFAIRAADGEVLWQRELGSPLSAPAAPSGDRLYLALRDGRILAMSLQTGEDIWSEQLAEPAAGILPVGNRVFVGGRDNQFHSLDAKDGDADWRWKTGADLLGLPVLDERRVYFIALDHILRGHSRNGGSMLWKRVLPMRPFTGPLLSGETLIVPGVAAELHAFNARNGEPAGKEFVLKGAENEEMLLAAPPQLTSREQLILVTRGGQVRAVGSAPASPAPASDTAPGPASPGPAGTPPATAPAPEAAPPPNTPAGAAGTTK